MPELTYRAIIAEASRFTSDYRISHDLPTLPLPKELLPYREQVESNFPALIVEVKKHLVDKNQDLAHGFEHLVWVASFASLIATNECQIRDLPAEQTAEILRLTQIAGLLHDVDRHLGPGEAHMIEGEQTARTILASLGLRAETSLIAVRNHDNPKFEAGSDAALEIVYGSLFDADHLRYGTEREEEFWRMKEQKGKTPQEVIHDYQFLPPFKDAWKTDYGKTIGPQLITYALVISEHIEKWGQQQ